MPLLPLERGIMKTLKLDSWRLCGFWPYMPLVKQDVLLGSDTEGVTHWMETTSQKSIYRTLEENGLIENPYKDLNSLKCEWVANRWWVYKTSFSLDKSWSCDDAVEVCFEGIDYKAHIYLNGKKIGDHEGVGLPFTADISAEVSYKGQNVLVCVVEAAPDEFAKFGYTPKVKTLKPRYNYYWDFSSRLVSIGLCGTVTVRSHETAALHYAHIQTKLSGQDCWNLSATVELDCYRKTSVVVKALLTDNTTAIAFAEKSIALRRKKECATLSMVVNTPKLWWPNGFGESTLYTLQLSIEQDGKLLQKQEYDVGFRTVEYLCADGSPDDALNYRLKINNRDIYIKGANVVPLDLLNVDVTEQQIKDFVLSAKNCNINLFRIWGGGVIESEYFYRACSRNGILIWQEFLQSSAGLDDVPCVEPHYMEMLRKVSLEAIKVKRNHPCLVYWCGGNELCNGESSDENGRVNDSVTYADANIAMLNGLVAAYDPDRMFLPSSGSVGHKLLDLSTPEYNYDVHGPWQYAGVQDEYTIFNNSNAIWDTEYGCGGLCDLTSVSRLTAQASPQIEYSEDSLIWRHHGGHWDKVKIREAVLFGDFKDTELAALIKCSQFIQAEAIRYGMEENRRKSFKNCATILWEYNDPFPNLHSSSIYDYYGRKKLAYYMFSDACRTQSATLRYSSLAYTPGDIFTGEIFAVNELDSMTTDITCTVTNEYGAVVFNKGFSNYTVQSGSNAIGSLKLCLTAEMGASFVVRLLMGRNVSEYLFFITDGDGKLSRRITEEFYDSYMATKEQL